MFIYGINKKNKDKYIKYNKQQLLYINDYIFFYSYKYIK